MDIFTLLGWLVAIVVVLFGILFDKNAGFVMDNLQNFWDSSSVVIVIGGVVSALMVAYPLKTFAKIPKHLKILFLPPKWDPKQYIVQIVDMAKEARINGLLSLESKLAETKDQFLKTSMMMVVDAVEPEKVKQVLEAELDALDDRHSQDRSFYDRASAFGPAFGMIGTLMGLINLMKSLDNPDAIAPAMAVALVTTFYGSILANVIFTPISSKLKARHDEEYLCKLIIVEGVQSIQAGDNARFIEEKLTQMLPAYTLKKGLPGGGASSGGDGGGKE